MSMFEIMKFKKPSWLVAVFAVIGTVGFIVSYFYHRID